MRPQSSSWFKNQLTLLFLELKLIFCLRQNTGVEILYVESCSITASIYKRTQKNLIAFMVFSSLCSKFSIISHFCCLHVFISCDRRTGFWKGRATERQARTENKQIALPHRIPGLRLGFLLSTEKLSLLMENNGKQLKVSWLR